MDVELLKLIPYPNITAVIVLILLGIQIAIKLISFLRNQSRLKIKDLDKDLDLLKLEPALKEILEEVKCEQLLYNHTKILASKKEREIISSWIKIDGVKISLISRAWNNIIYKNNELKPDLSKFDHFDLVFTAFCVGYLIGSGFVLFYIILPYLIKSLNYYFYLIYPVACIAMAFSLIFMQKSNLATYGLNQLLKKSSES